MKTIKYIGSKQKIIPLIDEIISFEKLEIAIAVDAFSGSGRVTNYFISKGYKVYSNDISTVSKLIIDVYLSKKNFNNLKPIIAKLNSLKGKEGFFTKKYSSNRKDNSLNYEGKKTLWFSENAKFLDSVRDKIDELYNKKEISLIEKKYLIYLLIIAMDKVDNTVGHQAGYLTVWAERALKKAKLEYIEIPKAASGSKSYGIDVFDFLKKIDHSDLIYLDPPYGSNNNKMPSSRVRYGLYYNVWKTVVLNDKPETHGRVNRRVDSDHISTYSVFEDYKKNEDDIWIAELAIKKMLELCNSKYTMLSYNNNARVPIENILRYLKSRKIKFKIFEIDHKKHVMSNQIKSGEYIRENEKSNREYIFLIWNKK